MTDSSVSSVGTLEDVKRDPHVLYLAMPVQQFDTIGGYKRFTEVFTVGLEAGRKSLKEWKEAKRLPDGLVDDRRSKTVAGPGARARRMSI